MMLQFHIILLRILCVITSKRNWVFTTTQKNSERMSSWMSNNNAFPKKNYLPVKEFSLLLGCHWISPVLDRLRRNKPRATSQFYTVYHLMKKYNNQVKFLHQNCQRLLGQRLLLKIFLSVPDNKCVSGF